MAAAAAGRPLDSNAAKRQAGAASQAADHQDDDPIYQSVVLAGYDRSSLGLGRILVVALLLAAFSIPVVIGYRRGRRTGGRS